MRSATFAMQLRSSANAGQCAFLIQRLTADIRTGRLPLVKRVMMRPSRSVRVPRVIMEPCPGQRRPKAFRA